MPYNISYDPEANCVFAFFEGTVDLIAIQRVAVEFIELSSPHGCLTLPKRCIKSAMNRLKQRRPTP